MDPHSTITFSLVIPAYNEACRLPHYLDGVRRYLTAEFAGRYEVIVVDDGSQDGLPGFLDQLQPNWPELSVLRHPTNRGKGAAIRSGMLVARGELLLFTDADGATPIEEEMALRTAIRGGVQIATGSRVTTPGRTNRTVRGWFRGFIGRCFAGLVRCLLDLSVRDSQCGFKLFTREAGMALFPLSRECGFLIDVEVLSLARKMGFRVAEVPVGWCEMPGSKVQLVRDGWKMFWGVWGLRRRIRVASEPPLIPVAGSPPSLAVGVRPDENPAGSQQVR